MNEFIPFAIVVNIVFFGYIGYNIARDLKRGEGISRKEHTEEIDVGGIVGDCAVHVEEKGDGFSVGGRSYGGHVDDGKSAAVGISGDVADAGSSSATETGVEQAPEDVAAMLRDRVAGSMQIMPVEHTCALTGDEMIRVVKGVMTGDKTACGIKYEIRDRDEE